MDKRVHYNNCKELAEYMFKSAVNGKYVVAALFYEEAIELVKSLLQYDEVVASALELTPSDYDGYADEYYISMDDDLELCVEPAMLTDRYLYTGADLLIAGCDVNAEILHNNDFKDYRIACIGDDCCEYEKYIELSMEDFHNAEIIKDDSGKSIGVRIVITSDLD